MIKDGYLALMANSVMPVLLQVWSLSGKKPKNYLRIAFVHACVIRPRESQHRSN